MKNLKTKYFTFFILLFCVCPQLNYSSNKSDSKILQKTARSLSFELVGQVGGPTQAVAVKDNYAYVGIGMRMIVLDVSNSSEINRVGETSVFDGFVTGVAVSGTKACVTTGAAGLYVVDISSPSQPSVLGFYDTPGYAENVSVKGSYAYVADGWSGLAVVNISNPNNPIESGYLSTVGYAFDVAVVDHTAYIAAGGAGLKVVDVEYPPGPIEIGDYNTPGYAYGIAFSDEIVYIADGWEGLQVINVSDSTQPVSLGSVETPGWAFGVAVKGSTLFVADAFKGLRVMDVSSPGFPSEKGACEFEGHAGRVTIAGNKAYVADKNNGLRIIDISKSNPIQVGFYSPLGYALSVAVSGNYAYIAAFNYGLRVIDISNPEHPFETGTYDTQGTTIGVAVSGNYVYASIMSPSKIAPGLHVVDASNPEHPTGVGYCESVGMPRDLVISDGIAYIANEWGLELIDISSPDNPTLVGNINFQGEEWKATHGVDVSGTLAYVVGQGGLYVVDVSSPASPTLMSNLNGPGRCYYDISISGTAAYITGNSGCLTIIDVSDSLNPTQLAEYCSQSLPEKVAVVNNTAYVAFGGRGLYGIDVSNSSNPTLTFSYDTPVYAIAAAVAGSFIYAADAEGGLIIIDMIEGQSGVLNPIRSKINSINTTASDMRSIQQKTLRFSPKRIPGRQEMEINIGKSSSRQPHQITNRHNANTIRTARTWVVASTDDSGPSTLRESIRNAGPGDIITFDPAVFPPQGPATIIRQGDMLSLYCGNLTIDASNAGVIMDGRTADEGNSGFYIDSDNNVIKGLQILNFPGAGISIESGRKNNIIGGNRTRGNGPTGEGNVLSGNGAGVFIRDTGTMYNIIIGNFIGIDVTGTSVLGNENGVVIDDGASFNRIGSLIPGEGNIISGNKNTGISIESGNPTGNIIIGNFIGTDVNGEEPLGNEKVGVLLDFGSVDTIIKDNLISDNNDKGISILSRGSSYNSIIGNLIGTDASGMKALGSCKTGVAVGYDGANYNRIGGTSPGDRNVISGNTDGIALIGKDNLILGNFIGTDISGTEAINNSTGIYISAQTRHNFIGGMTPQETNVISGAGMAGIRAAGTELQFIIGNYIGTDASGNIPLWDSGSGIELGSDSKNCIIYRNLISGYVGIQLNGNENIAKANILTQSTTGLNAEGDYNSIYYNRFLFNQTQASDSGINSWDKDGVGNYWSDYTGSDSDGDGIGDTPYSIPPNGMDHYPLVRATNNLAIQVNPPGSGSVTITPHKSSYNYKETVWLKANPAGGYSFSSWAGNVPSGKERNNPITITMDSDKEITANFTAPGTPSIYLNRTELAFGAVINGQYSTYQLFLVSNIGSGTLNWTVTADQNWLSCTPGSGTNSGTVTVSVDTTGLAAGIYTGTITVSDANASNSPQAVSVTLKVYGHGATSVPFGEFATPIHGSTVRSSIPVTGWVLDDIGVERVTIWRKDSNNLAKIDDATFVEGARPDVEAYYPDYPFNYRAGWGYMMLTNFLPGGDGTFVIHAIATDVEGNQVTLGTKSIIVDNANTVKPFGAIDTPGQGGTASGSSFVNWGWVLTPQPNSIPTDGSTINVWVDSVNIGNPNYNNYREDIASLFPGYANSNGAVGYFYLDTTAYENGVHTIQWTVRDSGGNSDGIGSRYFIIQNTGGRSDQAAQSQRVRFNYPKITDIPVDYNNPLRFKRGFDGNNGVSIISQYDKGISILNIRELERIELQLSDEGAKVTGFLIAGDQLRPLPIGSTLRNGTFCWIPGPGFFGDYRLVFIVRDKNGALSKREVVVRIRPRFGVNK